MFSFLLKSSLIRGECYSRQGHDTDIVGPESGHYTHTSQSTFSFLFHSDVVLINNIIIFKPMSDHSVKKLFQSGSE